jgi:hypothetical protein
MIGIHTHEAQVKHLCHDGHQHHPQVTFQSPGGHSSMPPIDGSTVGGKMGRLMAAVSAQPPPTKLVSPTREFMLGMADLAPGE